MMSMHTYCRLCDIVLRGHVQALANAKTKGEVIAYRAKWELMEKAMRDVFAAQGEPEYDMQVDELMDVLFAPLGKRIARRPFTEDDCN